MMQNVLLALSTRGQYQEIREKIRQPVTDKGTILKAKAQSAQKDILSVCGDPLILAQQLTTIELVSPTIDLRGVCKVLSSPHFFHWGPTCQTLMALKLLLLLKLT